MAKVEDQILEYLQWHNFTLAGDALRSEIMARRASEGALNDHSSTLSESIGVDNRCSQEGLVIRVPGHKVQDRKTLGLASSRSDTSSLPTQSSDWQSPEGEKVVAGRLAPQERPLVLSLDDKAAASKGGFQGAKAMFDRPVQHVQLPMLDSDYKASSYKQVPQTTKECKFHYQGTHGLQHSVTEDTEKGISESERDCGLEAYADKINASGSQFTSKCVKPKMQTSNIGILPALTGGANLAENGVVCDAYNRSSATHVRLKSGFPFSLSSSSYTPPKYQDPNPRVDNSNGNTTVQSGEYDGVSSSYCKKLKDLSEKSNIVSETYSAVLEPEDSRSLFKSSNKNTHFANKSHQDTIPLLNTSRDIDTSPSGLGRRSRTNPPLVSQGILQELPQPVLEDVDARQVPAFVENWDVDPYEGDDPGYYRQVIEDEEWFLAHEIDYPSDDERGRPNAQPDHDSQNNYGSDNEGHACAREELLFSGEEYHKNTSIGRDNVTVLHHHDDSLTEKDDHGGESATVGQCIVDGLDDTALPYETGILERGFLAATEGDWYGSKGDVYLNDIDAHFDCEAKNDLSERSSEEDPFNYGAHKAKLIQSSTSLQMFVGAAESHQNLTKHSVMHNDEVKNEFLSYYDGAGVQNRDSADPLCTEEQSYSSLKHEHSANARDTKTFCHEDPDFTGLDFNGFSFPSSSAGELVGSRAESGNSLWSGRDAMTQSEDVDEFGNGASGADDTLASWRRKSGEFSPLASPQDDGLFNMASSTHSTLSVNLFDDSISEVRDEDIDGAEGSIGTKKYVQATTVDRKDREALEEQLQKFQACQEEFETFNLRILHRKNRTGFEEEKDFPVEINSIIAGRYHVTEYLGSAAFSKAIQAHDLHTGMDVCMKIVKNNKDFFDQSLDEIKLLKYINKHDPTDKHHILRLYDYFYHREHLFIVCELLRANLYEFQKYNKESGGEVYFTMPRLQAIARQCLEAMEFLHQLGLIHCDLKPENILIKSYSKCEVKVIDVGSSCFQTDSLCSYVQSRSYRAPEVILGLPYDQKIDMWSLGCILAELCSGTVLFQNESLPTLLARVVGILGPIDTQMLVEGSDTYKFFTKNHMLYEQNQELNRLHYIIPRMTSLENMLPMGDEGFIEFVRYILQVNPKKRPTALEALNHSWIKYSYEPISG